MRQTSRAYLNQKLLWVNVTYQINYDVRIIPLSSRSLLFLCLQHASNSTLALHLGAATKTLSMPSVASIDRRSALQERAIVL